MGNYNFTNYFTRSLIASDLFSLTVAIVIAASLVVSELNLESISSFLALRLSVSNILLFATLLFVWYVTTASLGLTSQKAIEYPSAYLGRVVMMTTIGMISLGVFALLFRFEIIDVEFLAYFWVIATVLSIVLRYAIAGTYKKALGKLEKRPSLVFIGINSRSIQLADQIQAMRHPSHRIVGFVDDEDYMTGEFEQSSYKLVATTESLLDYIRTSPIDEVVISLPMKSRYDDASRIVSNCEEQGITVRIMADLFQYKMTHSRAESFAGSSVITVAFHGMTGLPATVKRCMDAVLSGAALVALAPLFVVVAVIVKLDSSGPAFFSQKRVGLNKNNFQMIKFRTMVEDAEARQGAIEGLNEAAGPAFKIKDDPRITTVGRILRATSIDELPQLINVFKGEMSLVGPRPLPLRDYSGFSEDRHRRRVSVRPGMTGLWQVESRDHSSFDLWMRLDMQYIDQWSLWLDIKIILKTIPAMLRGSGD